MDGVAFVAQEYHADGALRPARYEIEGAEATGWRIRRDGAPHLDFGPGYRVLRASHCGVCATDLARRHLPFPLPQVTGHEVVALGDGGRPVVVEINASHAARGLVTDCPWCGLEMGSHCPDRRVLGIHDLPGGFSPWILAPRAAIHAVPPAIDPLTATLVEPFAAALAAVRMATRVPRRRIAVLGPRRLGSLVVAALAAWRRRAGAGYEILALARRPELRALATACGADDARDPDALHEPIADVVVDTTGSPAGFARALALASGEVHLKTTCGEPSCGLAHATAMVVDEIALVPLRDDLAAPFDGPRLATAVVLPGAPRDLRPAGLRLLSEREAPALPLGGADVVVAGSLAEVDAAVRPRADRERGLVRPRGIVVLADTGQTRDALTAAVLDRGISVTTSRCGDFATALDVLPDVGTDLAPRLVSNVMASSRLADAFATAAHPSAIKVVVTHPEATLLA